MGWLFKSNYNKEKESIINYHVNKFIAEGVSPKDALVMTKTYIKRAEENLNKPQIIIPFYTGNCDGLLKAAKENQAIKEYLDCIRKEGVCDNDIRDWYDRSALSRSMHFEIAAHYRVNLSALLFTKGRSSNEIEDVLIKTFPVYGEPNDTSNYTGDDRPLPIELWGRITNKYAYDSSMFNNEIQSFSSFNAYIRSLIREGNL
ncbi:MAG: hypothetical protein M1308_19235 [Actinobacteria bacterium]|nr:hypothetical protein [Actinomycetota bacterium]